MIKRTASNYLMTRKQKRYVARKNMEKKGIKKSCKHSYISNPKFGGETTREPSYFAKHWREFLEVAE